MTANSDLRRGPQGAINSDGIDQVVVEGAKRGNIFDKGHRRGLQHDD